MSKFRICHCALPSIYPDACKTCPSGIMTPYQEFNESDDNQESQKNFHDLYRDFKFKIWDEKINQLERDVREMSKIIEEMKKDVGYKKKRKKK